MFKFLKFGKPVSLDNENGGDRNQAIATPSTGTGGLMTPQRRAVVEQDDEVIGALDVRLSALHAYKWELTGGTESQRLNFDKHRDVLISSLFDAIFYGHAIIQIVPGDDGIYQTIGEDIDSFRVSLKNGEYSAYTQINNSPVDVLRVFPTRSNNTFFHLAVFRGSKKNPTGRGLVSLLYAPVLARKGGWEFWQKYMERHSIPWTWAKAHGGDLKKIADSLVDAIQDAVVVTNANVDVSLIHPTSDNGAHEAFTRAANRRIHKIILGQTLTTEINDSGSYAAARVHNLVRKDKLANDVAFIRAQLNEIARRVYGDSVSVTAAPNEQIDIDRDMKLYQMGVRFSSDYIESAYGIPKDKFKLIDQAEESNIPPVVDQSMEAIATLKMDGAPKPAGESGSAQRFTKTQRILEQMTASAAQDFSNGIENDLNKMIDSASSYDDLINKVEQYFESRTVDHRMVSSAINASIIGSAAESHKEV